MRIFYVIILYFMLLAPCQGQEPYHFILGNEEFSNIDIYGIKQTDDGVYWIVSDKGLYSYNGYIFRHYRHPNQLSSSLFNLKTDHKGAIYCNNFNGQIFRVEKGDIELFHTVPDSLLSPYITFDFLTDNSLVVYAMSCYKMIDGKIHLLLSESLVRQGSIGASRDYENRLLSYNADGNTYRISTDTTEQMQLDIDKSIPIEYFLRLIYHEKGIFASDNGRSIMLAKQMTNHRVTVKPPVILPSQAPSELYFTKNHFWFTNRTHGVVAYQIPDEFSSIQNFKASPILFNDYFISTIFEDKNGNVLLGTFDEGIIVIPKTAVANNLLPNLKIAKIALADNDDLYIGDESGSLYLYNSKQGSYTTIFNNGEKTFDLLESYPDDKRLFAMVNQFISLNSSLEAETMKIGAVKDITRLQKGVYFLANNYGICKLDFRKSSFPSKELHVVGRSYSICYDQNHIFVGTSSGLLELTLDGVIVSEFTFNSEKILASGLEYSKAGLLVATQKYGLLKQGANGLEPFIDTDVGLISNSINHFQLKDSLIFIASERGFQVFDLSGELLRTLGNSDGLNSTSIKDFALSDQYIWLLHKAGLQRMSFNELFKQESISRFKKIAIYHDNQVISPDDYMSLAHYQNKIKVELQAPSLERQKDLTYSYFLEGIDQEWSEHQYHNNTIEYKSLPPGKYTFKVALKYKQIMQEEREISFFIRKPYWQTWWFYSLFGVFVLSVAYFFFRQRLKILNQKALQINELNTSKLSALQSQMNPHFIFNALNSIQDYIMLNERKLAGKYLGKFADLMRIYLNYSQLKNITLDEEIQALQLYLELEQLRFGESLMFSISVQQDVQAGLISFPSLLIQPYVENALKHGLFHQKGQKQLSVIFNISEDGCFLEAQIIDNGVGRKKAGEINKMRNPNHQSFATGATQHRLDLLNHGNKKPIKVKTEDLYGKDGEGTGTKVMMSIPLGLD